MNGSSCTPIVIEGSHRQIGERFGELSKTVFPSFLQQSSTWKELQHWKGSDVLSQIRSNIECNFPWVLEELDGMSASMGMCTQDLLLWNARGDLLHRTQDGCTSVTSFSEHAPTCGHNEDGDPFLSSKCYFVDVRPLNSPRFVSFFYPGSIPGHSFGFNCCQVMHTVNNLRMKFSLSADIWRLGTPRMVIARALLGCSSAQKVVDLLREHRPIGGYHYTVCQMSSSPENTSHEPYKVLSIEHTSEKCSVVLLNSTLKFVHTNHTVHDQYMSNFNGSSSDGVPHREVFSFSNINDALKTSDSTHNPDEVVSLSSFTRYQRASSIAASFSSGKEEKSTCVDVIWKILTDTTDESVNSCPLFRQQPDDPDEENTIVTVSFTAVASSGSTGTKCLMNVFNFKDAAHEPLLQITL